MHHIAKINISRVMMLFCFPVWLWQEPLCVDRRDASRRVSLLRSLMTQQSIWAGAFLKCNACIHDAALRKKVLGELSKVNSIQLWWSRLTNLKQIKCKSNQANNCILPLPSTRVYGATLLVIEIWVESWCVCALTSSCVSWKCTQVRFSWTSRCKFTNVFALCLMKTSMQCFSD